MAKRRSGDLARELAIREKSLGPEHPDTVESLHNLAEQRQREGDRAGARALYERALAIIEKTLGPDDPETARCLAALGGLLWNQRKFAEARPLCERALAIYEKALGPAHAKTEETLTMLALLLRAQGNHTVAQPLFERAEAIRANNEAVLLVDRGDVAGARPLFERVLAILENAPLGAKYPNTEDTLTNLGHLLWRQGELAEARPLLERALAMRERALGAEHPEIAKSLTVLADLRQAQGDLAGAQALIERALAITEKAVGPEHRDTRQSLYKLAALLRVRGDAAAVKRLEERIRENSRYREAVYHREAGVERHNKGDLLSAKRHYETAVAITEELRGPDHPDTATNINQLGLLLRDQGKLVEAQALFERVLGIRERALGPEHPDTVTSLNNLIGLHQAQVNLTAAPQLHKPEPAIQQVPKSTGGAIGHYDNLQLRRPLSKSVEDGAAQLEGPLPDALSTKDLLNRYLAAEGVAEDARSTVAAVFQHLVARLKEGKPIEDRWARADILVTVAPHLTTEQLSKVLADDVPKISDSARGALVAKVRHIMGPVAQESIQRPKWRDRQRYMELKKLSAPDFLKQVHAAEISADKTVYKETIRALDPELMDAVESYISKRTKRKLDLGDASDLIFIVSHEARNKVSREVTYRKRFGKKSKVVVKALRETEKVERQRRRSRRRNPQP